MEVALRKLEETWTRVQFQFLKHKDTPINTIKMAEEDFEALEDNQVLVQGMMANRYMATFKDEILGWNKKLMNVADVNQVRRWPGPLGWATQASWCARGASQLQAA